MSYHCDTCDKTILLHSKNIQFESLYHREYEKLIQKNYTIKNL